MCIKPGMVQTPQAVKPEVFRVRRMAHDDVTGTLPEVFPPPLEVCSGNTLLQPESHPVAQGVMAGQPVSMHLSPPDGPGPVSLRALHAATASV